VIWDLFHFGWPDHLDIFTHEWQESFGIFAGKFARLWQRCSGQKVLFVAPVNEISFFSWAGGEGGALNPLLTIAERKLKRKLVAGFLTAARALRAEAANVTIIAPEPVIHIAGDPEDTGDMVRAETFQVAMFEAWDMPGVDFREVRASVPHKELIYTGPVDEYFDCRFGKLPYRSLEFRHETRSIPKPQSVAVVNHPNEHDYTRVTEFKHLTGQRHEKTSVWIKSWRNRSPFARS
jgi:hypothetical protein